MEADPPQAGSRQVKRGNIARASGRWAIAGPDGSTSLHTTMADLLNTLDQHGRTAFVLRDAPAVLAVGVYLQDQAHANDTQLPEVSARGTGGGSIELGGVRAAGAAWHITTGQAIVSDAAAGKSDAGPKPDTDDPAVLAEWSRELHDHWSAAVDDLGLDGSKLSAGTAAAAILPRSWIKASSKLSLTPAWLDVRKAYAGGRVACFQPGWEGEAIEYDLRIAYGAALAGMLGPMPDFQLYADRHGLKATPAWLDVDVRVSGSLAPLPYRDPDHPWRLEWPKSGTWRGWYTAADLDTPGVEVVRVHACHRGRYRTTLADAITPLLERRETAGSWQRSIIRQLVVSLSGKLGQRPIAWRVWGPLADARPPPGAVHVGGMRGAGLTLYPCTPARTPPTLIPMVASYVTARTRRKLFDAITAAGSDRVIYCDTDSYHIPQGMPAPADCGSAPGQWAAKESGAAHYLNRRRYRIGSKRVNC